MFSYPLTWLVAISPFRKDTWKLIKFNPLQLFWTMSKLSNLFFWFNSGLHNQIFDTGYKTLTLPCCLAILGVLWLEIQPLPFLPTSFILPQHKPDIQLPSHWWEYQLVCAWEGNPWQHRSFLGLSPGQ